MKSIKKRIYLQNGILIFTIVFLLESIFILGIKNYYYTSVKRELLSKVNSTNKLLNIYLIKESIYAKSTYVLENDAKNPTLYMQIIDLKKNVVIDSNGVGGYKVFESSDIALAFKGKDSIYRGIDKVFKTEVMSVALPIYDRNHNISGILRYIVSIEAISDFLSKITVIALIVGLGIILISFFLSSYLAKGIINPIKSLTHTAQSMAKGNFSNKALKVHNDEIGALCDTLNYMAEEIVRADNTKNDFISSISHELRTPLTAIEGWSEIILTGEANSMIEIKEGVNIIHNESKRLKLLVNELLDFSKLESGRMTLNLENIDINLLVVNVCKYFKKTLNSKNIKLSLNICDDPTLVTCDVNRIKQVLINIIDNSIKFMDINPRLSICTYKKDSYIFIQIEDNGIGISPDEISKVTERFYKGNSKKSGSGIGLAISKEILQLHSGELLVNSETIKGTTVTIKLNEYKE